MLYGKKGLIEELGNQILMMEEFSSEAKETLLFEQLNMLWGTEKAALDDVLLEYINSVLNPTLENLAGTNREYTNLKGLYKILNTLLKDPASNQKEIEKYQKLIEHEKSHLSVHLNALAMQRGALAAQVACLVSSDKAQVISEKLDVFSKELADLQVIHAQTIDENELTTPNMPEKRTKSLFQEVYDYLWSGTPKENDEDNTPKAG